MSISSNGPLPVNLSMNSAEWVRSITRAALHAPTFGRRPMSCQHQNQRVYKCLPGVCYDQRISAPELCSCCPSCTFCQAGAVGRWTTPSGVVLESLTSATVPSFQFAYNPLDVDMLHIRRRLVVEPALTALWKNVTQTCCAAGGLVIDIGANFGWYTLFSLALGCHVVAFEPVSDYRDVERLGAFLNHGFAQRLQVFGNVVFDAPGNYTMVVPRAGMHRGSEPRNFFRGYPHHRAPSQAQQAPSVLPAGKDARSAQPVATLKTHRRTMLGMAAMLGPGGQAAVKNVMTLGPAGTTTYVEHALSTRVDDVVSPEHARARRVCMLKSDVEGLEPQSLRTASRLLSLGLVEAVQLELNRKDSQRCANIRMLRDLLLYGFRLSKVKHGAPCWDERCVTRVGTYEEDTTRLQSTPVRPGLQPAQLSRTIATAHFEAADMYRRVFPEFSSNILGWRMPGFGVGELVNVHALPLRGHGCAT